MLHRSQGKYEFLAFVFFCIIALIVETKFFPTMEKEIYSIAFGLSGFCMFFRPLWFLFYYPKMKKCGENVKGKVTHSRLERSGKRYHGVVSISFKGKAGKEHSMTINVPSATKVPIGTQYRVVFEEKKPKNAIVFPICYAELFLYVFLGSALLLISWTNYTLRQVNISL